MIRGLLRSKLAGPMGLYTLANLGNALLPFLLLPVLTRYLPPSDYGILAMFQVLVGIAVPFVGLSIHGAIGRQYVERETIDLPAYIGNCFMILAASTVLAAGAVALFAPQIASLAAFPADTLWTVVAIAAGQFVTLSLLTLWQMQMKPVPYVLFQLGQMLLGLGLSLLMVVGLELGWEGRVFAQLITSTAAAALALGLLARGGWIKLTVVRGYLEDALRFGVPLVPHALGGWLIFGTDRLFLTNMVGVEETGLYAVAYQVGLGLGLLVTSFNQAWVPWLYAALKEAGEAEGPKRRIVAFSYGYFVAMIVLALSLTTVAPWLLSLLVAPIYRAAAAFVFWVAIGQAFGGMYKMVANYLFYAQKTHMLAWVTFGTAVINVPLCYALIRLNGAIGAAQATAIAQGLSFVGTWVLAQRVYPMPWGAVAARKEHDAAS